MKKTSLSLILSILLLSGCGGKDASDATTEAPSSEEVIQYVSAARTAVISMQKLANAPLAMDRPSALLGIAATIFIEKNKYPAVSSAMKGVGVQLAFSQNIEEIDDERFVLLQEFGATLQVDITETLNQSINRQDTLNTYIESLTAITAQALDERDALDKELDELKEEVKEQRRVVRDGERAIKDALEQQEYATAGELQEALASTEADLAILESRQEQTNDIYDTFDDLVKIGEERIVALEKNREILISGLKVIDVPGIEDLNIVEKESLFRRAIRTR